MQKLGGLRVRIIVIASLVLVLGAVATFQSLPQDSQRDAELSAETFASAWAYRRAEDRADAVLGSRLVAPIGETVTRFGEVVRAARDQIAVAGRFTIFIYVRSSNGWSLQQRLPVEEFDSFDFDGNTLALGFRNGGVGVYREEGGRWVEDAVFTHLEGPVSIDGHRLAMANGSTLEIWEREFAGWARLSSLSGPPLSGSSKRESLAPADPGSGLQLEGGTLVSLVRRSEVLVFLEEADGSWQLDAALPVSGEQVAISGGVIVSSGPDWTAFEPVERVWLRQELPVGNRGLSDGKRGARVAIDDDLLVVAASTSDLGNGACQRDVAPGCQHGIAYLLERDRDGEWEIRLTLASDSAADQRGDRFGESVDIEAGTLVIGAPGDNAAVYVFEVTRGGSVAADAGFPRPLEPGSLERMSARVTVDRLNVREGPGTQFEVLRQYNVGDEVTLVGRSDSWLAVEGDGWVFYSSQWLDLEQPLELLQELELAIEG